MQRLSSDGGSRGPCSARQPRARSGGGIEGSSAGRMSDMKDRRRVVYSLEQRERVERTVGKVVLGVGVV